MQPGRSSKTAQFMALFRALETVRPARRRLFCDPFAAGFLDPPLRRLVRWSASPLASSLVCAFIDRFWPGARTSGVARTRLIDGWIAEAAAGGARQVMLLGAGFDSRAWRLPALEGLRVFEVDHPATAAEKRARMAGSGADPSRVTAVALDLDRESLPDRLAAAGFDPATVTIVVWEGVTNYLNDAAVGAVLAWAGTLASGSRLIFTYVHRGVLSDPTRFAGAPRILLAVASAGEPWTYGMLPETLAQELRIFGLRLVADLGADDYRARCFGRKAARMHGYAFYRAALAVVDHA
jgi:methyltransferase (TIGR00027 family)